MRRLVSIVVLSLLVTSTGWAASRQAQPRAQRTHYHEDLFNEDEAWAGVKFGPQLSGYTSVNMYPAMVDVQSSFRYAGGVALKLLYSWPKFEADLLWNARGVINGAGSIHSLAVPLLLKLPFRVSPEIEFELGGGFQSEYFLSGVRPHTTFMFGWVAAAGIGADLGPAIFELEGRYFAGQNSIVDMLPGGNPRDVQILAGLMWRI